LFQPIVLLHAVRSAFTAIAELLVIKDSASSQVAGQLRNGAANALKQLRDVEQIGFEFVSKYSKRNAWSSQLNGQTVPDSRSLDGVHI